MNPFFARENDKAAAYRKAKKNENFWILVFSGQGLSYSELKQMDLADYAEAVEAKRIYDEKVETERKRAQSTK